jgi:hypothetical protein
MHPLQVVDNILSSSRNPCRLRLQGLKLCHLIGHSWKLVPLGLH